MQDFRNLGVWKKSHLLPLELYRLTADFPNCEIYGLTSQIRRAGASIPANIAEGCYRGSDLEFKHFLTIALGSASEFEYHLLLAKDLGFLKEDVFSILNSQTNEVKKMLIAFINKLKESKNKINNL
jgi:four helix bundle protein